MKKVLGIILTAALLSSCAQKESKSEEQEKTMEVGTKEGVNGNMRMTEVFIDEVEYHVYETGSSYSGVHVINHTKELLEIELLTLQIDSLNK